MAPILLKKREDNNHDSYEPSMSKRVDAKTTVNVSASSKPSSSCSSTRVSLASREKTREESNNIKSRKTKEPEAPETPAPRRVGSSLRSTTTTKEKPVSSGESASRRTGVKTPPAAAPLDPSPVQAVQRAVHPLPSQTLNKHKQAAVWTTGKKKHKTLLSNSSHSNFGSMYDSGSIPCRINHGGIRNVLQWTKEPDTLDFNPYLVACVEGFLETEHPFVFLSRTMFRELLRLDDAREKTMTVLPQVIPPLRMALMSSDDDIFLMALEATRILSDLVEEELNTYLSKLAQQIHRKLLTKQLRNPVEETLATLERNGGKEALTIIRSKIPTYISVH